MPATDPVRLLQRLAEFEPPAITGQSIDLGAGAEGYRRLIACGALVEHGVAAALLCLDCDAPHDMPVEHAGDGRFRARCPDVGYRDVEVAEIRRYAVSEAWIVRTFRRHFGKGDGADLDPTDVLHRVGRVRIGRYPVELCFARRLDQPERFAAMVARLSRWIGTAPAIVITSSDPGWLPHAPPPRTAVAALADVLVFEGDRAVVNEDPLLALLRGPDPRFASGPIGFTLSDGYRSAIVGDQHYTFTDKQARIVEALHVAWMRGGPRVHQDELKGAADTTARVGQLFRGHPAYGTLIRYDSQGYYWLDL